MRLRLLIAGLAIVLAEAAGLALFTFWADHTFRLGVPARIGLLIAAIVVLAVECGRRIVAPLLTPLGLVALAGAIGRKTGDERKWRSGRPRRFGAGIAGAARRSRPERAPRWSSAPFAAATKRSPESISARRSTRQRSAKCCCSCWQPF